MDGATLKKRLLNLQETFEEREDTLTELDRDIGDGDHGVNMVRGFKALKAALENVETVPDVLKTTGMTLMSKVGGASGPLYGFGFVKMAQVAEDEITDENLPKLLQAFSDAVAQRGKVELNEKTMYDVIEPARAAVEAGESVDISYLQQLADETYHMVATKGRAAYYKEESRGHTDPGAQSSVYVLNALIGDD